ncbi:MAG: flagellar motor switch protein FliN [Beijerinckiaceae bacterium]|nr:flagellar motor switch protein FliN [Beijerinckiaceae bacterium]
MDETTQALLPDIADVPADMAADMPSMAHGAAKTAADLEHVFDVPVTVSAVLGRTRLEIASLVALGPGAILELDRRVGEPIDVFVNNRLVARGEVVLIDEKLGVTMTEIVKHDR